MLDGGSSELAIPDLLRGAILDALQGARIVAAETYRRSYVPFPALVTLESENGDRCSCVVKISGDPDRITIEASVLRALAELGLPVPIVLSGPLLISEPGQPTAALILSQLPGRPLPWVGLADLDGADRTCRLIHEAIDAIHALTPRIQEHPVAALLPSVTLESELQTIIDRGGPWFGVPFFREAIQLLSARLPSIETPLVFSSGDYNPLNFLHDDQSDQRVTGWVDFESSRFEDPYIGFAKFLLWADDDYGWGAGAKSGLVERYLYRHNVLPGAFDVRLVLRGLSYVQSHSPDQPPRFMLKVIESGVTRLKR